MDATTEQTSGSIQVEQENPSTDPPGKLDALYVQSMPEAVGLAYLLTGDLDLATEIGEEAFVRGAGRFEHRLGRVRFPTWLRRSVVTVFLLHERRAEAEGPDRTDGDVPAPVEGRPVELPTDDDGVWPRVLGLPPRERAAVVLRHCRGLSEDEVGEVLRCSVRAARAMVARGLAMLEPKLEDGETR